jgi:transposase-like protein
MPTLSQDAQAIFMKHRCPRCGHTTTRQGSSFRSIRHYHCSACGEQVRLTYKDKQKLFREHAVESESAV